jgi:hypothetical protein
MNSLYCITEANGNGSGESAIPPPPLCFVLSPFHNVTLYSVFSEFACNKYPKREAGEGDGERG